MVGEMPVLTPEKTIVSYRLAGMGGRATAQLLDILLLAAAYFGTSLVASIVLANIDPGLVALVLLSAPLLLFIGYFTLCEGLWNGLTVGKLACGLRVRMADGTPITFPAALTRNILRVGDLLPGFYFVGLVAVFTNPRSQRLGDLAAGTVVVYEPREAPVFRTAPHQVGIHFVEPVLPDLRGMSAEDYQALRRFVDRYPELSTAAQHRLLNEFWFPFAEKHKVPPLPGVDPVEVAGGVVMKYGRQKGLL